jgi:hypothetical protein
MTIEIGGRVMPARPRLVSRFRVWHHRPGGRYRRDQAPNPPKQLFSRGDGSPIRCQGRRSLPRAGGPLLLASARRSPGRDDPPTAPPNWVITRVAQPIRQYSAVDQQGQARNILRPILLAGGRRAASRLGLADRRGGDRRDDRRRRYGGGPLGGGGRGDRGRAAATRHQRGAHQQRDDGEKPKVGHSAGHGVTPMSYVLREMVSTARPTSLRTPLRSPAQSWSCAALHGNRAQIAQPGPSVADIGSSAGIETGSDSTQAMRSPHDRASPDEQRGLRDTPARGT